MNKLSTLLWRAFSSHFPQIAARIMYWHIMGRMPHFNHPRDLNEKINYLKFHSDIDEWARLADKYLVREYVKERGLNDALVHLYGKFDTPQELISDWSRLPDKFVIKSNHGCGTIKIVLNKKDVNLDEIKKEAGLWLKMRFGIDTVEPQYLRIKPCLIVEELLEDISVAGFSQSLVDYKIFCFDGQPHFTLVVADRNNDDKTYKLDCYDMGWHRIDGALTAVHDTTPLIEKPANYTKMIEYARTLSQGHKQVRVDLYNIAGGIYFGEMTFTSQGGYMNYFTSEFLLKMGNQFEV